jgi:hypothetical protein
MRRGGIATGLLLLAGCTAAPYEERVQYAPEPPPPERAEISAPPEESGEVWIAGRWVREENGWAWLPGFYTTPPQRNRIWVAGRWAPYNNTSTWSYEPGTWAPLRELRPEDIGPLAKAPDGTPLLSLTDFLAMELPR